MEYLYIYTYIGILYIYLSYIYIIYIYISGWWFQSLWKILVSWGYYSQYMESHKIHVPNHQPDIFIKKKTARTGLEDLEDFHTKRTRSIRWASGDFHRMFLQGFVQGRSKDGQGQSKRGSHLERRMLSREAFCSWWVMVPWKIWLVVDLPLWKIWIRQLGWWNSQLNGKIIPNHQPINQ